MSLFSVTIVYFTVLLTSSALAAKPNVVLLMADDPGEKENKAQNLSDRITRMATSHSVWSLSCKLSLEGKDYGKEK